MKELQGQGKAAEAPQSAHEVAIPSGITGEGFWRKLSLYHLVYSLAGLALGLACILGGILLFLRGVSGATSWTARVAGIDSQISDAAPGALLFVAGVLVVWLTRFTARLGRKR